MYGSQILTGALFVIFLAAGGALVFVLIADRNCIHLHGIFCLFGTIFTGVAMLIFRLMRGMRTRVVKYVHVFLAIVPVVFFLAGYIAVEDNDYNPFIGVHIIPSYLTWIAYVFQMLVALLVFTFLYDDMRVRLYVAPFHDIFGIWVFLCLVGCLLTGKHPSYEVHHSILTRCFNFTSYFCFIIVFIVVLSPCLEWELVGRL